jgi:hypothetical protein
LDVKSGNELGLTTNFFAKTKSDSRPDFEDYILEFSNNLSGQYTSL